MSWEKFLGDDRVCVFIVKFFRSRFVGLKSIIFLNVKLLNYFKNGGLIYIFWNNVKNFFVIFFY